MNGAARKLIFTGRCFASLMTALQEQFPTMRIRFLLPVVLLWMLFACDLSRASDLALVGARIYLSPTAPPIENGTIVVIYAKR
jgi:hypothetical protein